MYTTTSAYKMIDERGPRWAVFGTIRTGESRTEYADTADRAEEIRDSFQDPAQWGYYQVKVYPPQGSVDLAQIGRERTKAKRILAEKTAILRAAVLRALEEKRSESEVARTGGVDRKTVRKWAGKGKGVATSRDDEDA